MVYRVKGQEINDYIESVDKLMTADFSYKVMEAKPFARETEWTGSAKDIFTKKYDGVITELEKIPSIISLYTDFLGKTLDSYEEAIEEFKKRFIELNKEFDEKGKKDELSSIL